MEKLHVTEIAEDLIILSTTTGVILKPSKVEKFYFKAKSGYKYEGLYFFPSNSNTSLHKMIKFRIHKDSESILTLKHRFSEEVYIRKQKNLCLVRRIIK